MDVEKLAKNALEKIKAMVDIPETGIIAGGSLANLIWEEVSGNKAVINDVDVFQFGDIVSVDDIEKMNKVKYSKNFYEKKNFEFVETYGGFRINSNISEYYRIDGVRNEGLLNIIDVISSENSSEVVINSFDINCTQISYSIDRDEFYWTDDFVDFLKTGSLRVINLMSPIHTSIRLVKKRDEMGAKLDMGELELCQYVVYYNLKDINRRYFTEKYVRLFIKYKKVLGQYFNLCVSPEISGVLSEKLSSNIKLFTFNCNKKNMIKILENSPVEDVEDVFDLGNVNVLVPKKFAKLRVDTSAELLLYVRKYSNIDQELYSNLSLIITVDDYFDEMPLEKDVEYLCRLINSCPDAIKKLRGMSFSKQMKSLDSLFSKYTGENKNTATYLLGHPKFELGKVNEYNEDDYLLFELNVRKKIADDRWSLKKSHILDDEFEDDIPF